METFKVGDKVKFTRMDVNHNPENKYTTDPYVMGTDYGSLFKCDLILTIKRIEGNNIWFNETKLYLKRDEITKVSFKWKDRIDN